MYPESVAILTARFERIGSHNLAGQFATSRKKVLSCRVALVAGQFIVLVFVT